MYFASYNKVTIRMRDFSYGTKHVVSDTIQSIHITTVILWNQLSSYQYFRSILSLLGFDLL